MKLYCCGTCLEINTHKYVVYVFSLEESFHNDILDFIPFPPENINEDMKYLGFFIKPKNYKKKGQEWIMNGIGRKNIFGCNCSLSHVVCLVFIKEVLESILVYWNFLEYIPRGTLRKVGSYVLTTFRE